MFHSDLLVCDAKCTGARTKFYLRTKVMTRRAETGQNLSFVYVQYTL